MKRSRPQLVLLSILACLLVSSPTGAQPAHPTQPRPARAALPSLAQPALSPDGGEVAFVSGGDIWTVSSEGGEARLLVSHPATESRPLYSPDGRRLAFVSDRAGSDDLYVLELATGEVRRVTYSDGAEHLDAWSPDGRWLYFTTGDADIGGMVDVYRVWADGGTPIPVLADRNLPEYFVSPSPDGSVLAFSARARMGFSQWWRNGSSHIDQAEIWLMTTGDDGGAAYRRLTEPGAKHLWPQWTADGRAVLYMSDRDGAENLWLQPADGGPARRLTSFEDGRVLWPNAARSGGAVVFERDFGIWRLDLPSGDARALAIVPRGASPGPVVERRRLTSDFSQMALAPDGRKLGFVARGDVFAAGVADGGRAERVTATTGPEAELSWAPDSRRLAYASRRDGAMGIHVYDFGTRQELRVAAGDAVATPVWSPDGNRLAFARDGREIVVVELPGGRERVVATGLIWRPPFGLARPLAWSPDGRWLAYLAADDRMFMNVYVARADAERASGVPAGGRAVSRLANSFGGSLAWSPDGRSIYFDTQHRTEDGRIARVDLVPRTPAFRDSLFWDLFRDPEGQPTARHPATVDRTGPTGRAAQAGPAGSPGSARSRDGVVVEIDFDGIFDRLMLLPIGLDVGVLTLSPDGSTLVFTASAVGQTNLYAWDLDPLATEPPVARQLTSTPGGKGLPWFTPDGKEVVYTDRGRIRAVTVADGRERGVDVTAEMTVDFHAEKLHVFDQAWTYMRDHFYDPAMHGADWGAVRTRFEPRVAGAATPGELERLMNLMLGELNASHLGHSIQRDRPDAPTGRLGLGFDPGDLERGEFRVARVIPLGPADIAGVRTGDRLLEVDGVALDATTSLDAILAGTVGRRVELRVAPAGGGDRDSGRGRVEARALAVEPIASGAERQLAYRGWVAERRAFVDSVSAGRLGYVHMPDMGWGSLQQLIVDLDAENFGRDGVVIDIRANRGGFVHAYALDVFARRGYLTMEMRGFPAAPARSMLGQRSLEAPTALVIDMNSLSDAEDFTEGYRALGLGPIIGEPTAGWIIYTWGATLVDGSSLRMPRTRIRGAAGDDMELYPRRPDITVTREPGEEAAGRDRQLERAVRELLGRR
jgi:tricorn protease